jgi:hypothetical protein
MKRLEYALTRLCEQHDTGGSFTSRDNRKKHLQQMGRQLHAMGFRDLRVHQLGGRHVNRLVRLWHDQHLSIGAMKNRLSHLRWWAKTIGRAHVIARANAYYGIPARPLTTTSQAVELTDAVLAAIDGPYQARIRVSLRLQRWLGLRTEESLKIRPGHAIIRDAHGQIIRVNLRGSWCKNGRTRSLLMRTDRQREALEDALRLAGNQSLIPPHMTYIAYLRTFQYRCRKVGLTHRHGLRHRYAQARYTELTGSLPPNGDGPMAAWAVDDRARQIISDELGHGRTNVTAAYVGKATRPTQAERHGG